ncbi:LysR family transcriptional regulator [Pseudomonas putida]|jgi:DNA-binding transcriptional LysR family regulator|uniref:LysR family transcriptional regulator n=1 Tax=Pseudomonas putida TaxID=303 RepID=UPI000B1FF65C|nr:LysR family transcriptional regulator [Pseudomonas putida]MDQ2487120.1 LysR family transcriptional regulator [Pseudomonas putida]
MMNWEDLRFFLAIGQSGTLSGAARALQVDQATVSRRLIALEASLGVRLVNRLPREAQLTAAGQQVLKQAMEIEKYAYSVKRITAGLGEQERTTVSISAPPILARHFLAPHLLSLSQKLEQAKLSIMSESHFASLARMEADLAVRLATGSTDTDIIKKVGRVDFALYAARTYPHQSEPARWEFVGYTERQKDFDHKRWLYQVIGERRVSCEVSDLSNQYEAACSGIGVAGLPCFLADRDERLVRLEARETLLTLNIWMAIHPDRRNDALIRRTMVAIIELVEAVGLSH